MARPIELIERDPLGTPEASDPVATVVRGLMDWLPTDTLDPAELLLIMLGGAREPLKLPVDGSDPAPEDNVRGTVVERVRADWRLGLWLIALGEPPKLEETELPFAKTVLVEL